MVRACSHGNFSFIKECAGVAGDATQLGESLPRRRDALGSTTSTPPNGVGKCQGDISKEVTAQLDVLDHGGMCLEQNWVGDSGDVCAHALSHLPFSLLHSGG